MNIKRKQRSDKGHKRTRNRRTISPEYAHYLSRWAHTGGRMLSEVELLALLDTGCSLCGVDAVRWRPYGVYCLGCDPYASVAGEAALLALVKRVSAYRL